MERISFCLVPKQIKKALHITLLISFLTSQAVYAAPIKPLELAPLLSNAFISSYNAPSFRFLSVNPLNPQNYFNFLLDKGDGRLAIFNLNKEAKELYSYFLIGLSLPNDNFWVNLNPKEPDRIISTDLAKTDMGKIMLSADLELKKAASRIIHPNHSKGKLFWNSLYKQVGSTKDIDFENRIWIVPNEASLWQTKDGVMIVKSSLKVMLENEYLKQEPKNAIQKSANQFMNEIIIPELTKEVNTSKTFAQLRQVYNSLILAQWYKMYVKSQLPITKSQSNSNDQFPIDQGLNSNIESRTPWSSKDIYQDYMQSYQHSEFKVEQGDSSSVYTSGGATFVEIAGSPIKGNEISGPQFANTVSAILDKGSMGVAEVMAVSPAEPTRRQFLRTAVGAVVGIGALGPKAIFAAGSDRSLFNKKEGLTDIVDYGNCKDTVQLVSGSLGEFTVSNTGTDFNWGSVGLHFKSLPIKGYRTIVIRTGSKNTVKLIRVNFALPGVDHAGITSDIVDIKKDGTFVVKIPDANELDYLGTIGIEFGQFKDQNPTGSVLHVTDIVLSNSTSSPAAGSPAKTVTSPEVTSQKSGEKSTAASPARSLFRTAFAAFLLATLPPGCAFLNSQYFRAPLQGQQADFVIASFGAKEIETRLEAYQAYELVDLFTLAKRPFDDNAAQKLRDNLRDNKDGSIYYVDDKGKASLVMGNGDPSLWYGQDSPVRVYFDEASVFIKSPQGAFKLFWVATDRSNAVELGVINLNSIDLNSLPPRRSGSSPVSEDNILTRRDFFALGVGAAVVVAGAVVGVGGSILNRAIDLPAEKIGATSLGDNPLPEEGLPNNFNMPIGQASGRVKDNGSNTWRTWKLSTNGMKVVFEIEYPADSSLGRNFQEIWDIESGKYIRTEAVTRELPLNFSLLSSKITEILSTVTFSSEADRIFLNTLKDWVEKMEPVTTGSVSSSAAASPAGETVTSSEERSQVTSEKPTAASPLVSDAELEAAKVALTGYIEEITQQGGHVVFFTSGMMSVSDASGKTILPSWKILNSARILNGAANKRDYRLDFEAYHTYIRPQFDELTKKSASQEVEAALDDTVEVLAEAAPANGRTATIHKDGSLSLGPGESYIDAQIQRKWAGLGDAPKILVNAIVKNNPAWTEQEFQPDQLRGMIRETLAKLAVASSPATAAAGSPAETPDAQRTAQGDKAAASPLAAEGKNEAARDLQQKGNTAASPAGASSAASIDELVTNARQGDRGSLIELLMKIEQNPRIIETATDRGLRGWIIYELQNAVDPRLREWAVKAADVLRAASTGSSPAATKTVDLDKGEEKRPWAIPIDNGFEKPNSKPASVAGIDLAKISFNIEDCTKVFSQNPVDDKIMRAAEMLKRHWNAVSALYLQEAMLLLKYNIVKEFSQRDLAVVLLGMLKSKDQLDEGSLNFLQILQAGRPIEELKLAFAEAGN